MNDANRKKLEVLIEAMIEQYLTEEEDIVAQDPLIKIFITPFTDVLKTAKGELEKNVAITTSTITNLAKQAAVLAIPFFAASEIDEIQKKADEKLKQRLANIDARYADVLKRNWDTVRGRDVWGITFMLDPSFGIAEKFILRAPYAALGVLEVLTGGNEAVTKLKNQARKLVTHVTPSYLSSVGGSSGGGGYGGGGGSWGDYGGGYGDYGGGFGEAAFVDGTLFTEQQAQPQQTPPAQPQQQQQAQAPQQPLTPQQQQQELQKINKQIADAVIALKSNPSVQQAMQKSPVAKQLQAGAFEAISEVMNPVLTAQSYEQIKKAIGPEFSKFEKEYLKSIPEELKAPDKLKELQAQMVPELKKAYKAMMVQQLQRLAKQHPTIAKPMTTLIQQISK